MFPQTQTAHILFQLELSNSASLLNAADLILLALKTEVVRIAVSKTVPGFQFSSLGSAKDCYRRQPLFLKAFSNLILNFFNNLDNVFQVLPKALSTHDHNLHHAVTNYIYSVA